MCLSTARSFGHCAIGCLSRFGNGHEEGEVPPFCVDASPTTEFTAWRGKGVEQWQKGGGGGRVKRGVHQNHKSHYLNCNSPWSAPIGPASPHCTGHLKEKGRRLILPSSTALLEDSNGRFPGLPYCKLPSGRMKERKSCQKDEGKFSAGGRLLAEIVG